MREESPFQKVGHLNIRGRAAPIEDRCFKFAVRVVKFCRAMQDSRDVPRPLVSQLLRAATSVGANVAEGQSAESRADFIHKMSVACKEARETHYWLKLMAAAEVVPECLVADLTDEANQLTAILTSITANAKRKSRPNVKE